MADWRTALANCAAKYIAVDFVPTTLCDMCGNACGHCRWSRKGVQKPVEGWDAVRRDIPVMAEGELKWVESYVVIDCPQFQLEDRCWAYYRMFDRDRIREGAMRAFTEGGELDEA